MRIGRGSVPTTSPAQQAPKTARTLAHLKRIAEMKRRYQERVQKTGRKGI